MAPSNLTPESRSSRRTRIIVILVVVAGFLHHVDHVLRADHSGWPFIEQVTPFTISLFIAYPVAAFVFFARGWFWLKFWLVTLSYIFTQGVHIFIETPNHQYLTWATNASPDPDSLGQPNLLDIASPPVGVYAVVLSLLLSAVLITAMISTYMDAREANQQPAVRHQNPEAAPR